MLRTLVSAFIHTLLLHFWLLSFTLCHHFFHFCFSSDILGPSPSPCNFMFLSFYFPSLYSGCNQYKIQSEGFRQKKIIYFICSAFTGSENYHVTLTVLQDVKFGQNEYKLNEYFALHCNKKRKKKQGKKACGKTHYTSLRFGTTGNTFHAVELKTTVNVMWINFHGLTRKKRICFLYWTFLVWRMLEIIVKQTCVYLHRYMFRLHRSTIHRWILKMNDKMCWERTFPFTHTKQFIKQFIYIISAEFVTVCSKSFIDYVCFYKR